MSAMYVAGEWVEREDATITNPFSGEPVGAVPIATAAEAERALQAAVTGSAAMRALAPVDRVAILRRAGDRADGLVEELARTIAGESGKTLGEARGEASRAGELLRLSAAEGARLHGETLPLDASANGVGKLGFTLRQPCGVVVAIAPFNFPLLLVLHKIAPALAAGNAVILKPAAHTPLTALALTGLLVGAGLPDHALQCLTGPGPALGPLLCGDRRVRKISFTGSSAVGEQITRVAGVKRLSLELGASCPTLVLRDGDIEAAAAAVAVGGYANAGQVCISVQRVLVDHAVHGDFLDAVLPRVQAIRAGDQLDAATTMGPLISIREAERVTASLRAAQDRGAQVLTGGERDGALVSPAVVDGVSPADPLSQEELFGPGIAVTAVDGVEEAIRVANDSRYGLGAGVFTRDIRSAMRFAREVDCGALHINWTPLWRADAMPYGGLKASGVGKEGPRYAVEEMTELKTVVFHDLD